MLGFFFALLAGSLLSVQNIFNSKVSERAGSWATTTLVLGLGFAASMLIGFLLEGPQVFNLKGIKFWYWFSGLLGIGVITFIVKGVKLLGPTYAISISLTTQLVLALCWDTFGFLGVEKVPFSLGHLFGVLMIISGIVVYKFTGSLGSLWINLKKLNKRLFSHLGSMG